MIYNHPIGSIYQLYTTYILPIGWLYATYHLVREPGNSIDIRCRMFSINSSIDIWPIVITSETKPPIDQSPPNLSLFSLYMFSMSGISISVSFELKQICFWIDFFYKESTQNVHHLLPSSVFLWFFFELLLFLFFSTSQAWNRLFHLGNYRGSFCLTYPKNHW